MAAANTDLLRNYLECRICLEIFENPKVLECNHHFCQRCLEDIIHFEGNGSAKIACPLRCNIETHLGPLDTVSNLPISYEFKGLLEALRPDKDKLNNEDPKCICGNAVAIYCCRSLMCLTCFNKEHSKQHVSHKNTSNLTLNRKTGELEVVCKEHSIGCSYFVGNFICLYCLNRDRQYHNEKDKDRCTIKNTVDLLKEAVMNEKKETDAILRYQKVTEDYLGGMERKLEIFLGARERECLRMYEDFLSRKKTELLEKFKLLSTDHMGRYSETNEYGEFLQDTLMDSDISLCFEKTMILDRIIRSSKKSGFYAESISISPSNFLSDVPLGDLSISKEKEIDWNDTPLTTFSCEDITEINVDVAPYEKETFENLSQLTKSLKEYEKKLIPMNNMKLSCEERLAKLKEQCELLKDEKNKSISQLLRQQLQILPQAFLDISIDGVDVGRIIIDLYCNDVPKTCENFIHLCLHTFDFGYKNSKFYHITPTHGFCSGGKIVCGDQERGKSIYGSTFERENFIRKHDDKGIVSMRSKNTTVDSRFDITGEPQPDWDDEDVVFGKVTKETYHVVEEIISKGDRRPTPKVIIRDCGVFR